LFERTPCEQTDRQLQERLGVLTGVHAAAFTALIRASRRRNAWLGGAVAGEDLFPLMDGEHLAANRIFLAPLRSRS
jgi:hypothetical protein